MKEEFDSIKKLYDRIRKKGLNDDDLDLVVAQIINESTALLSELERVALISKVPSKTYFSFKLPDSQKLSRAINEDLYGIDSGLWSYFVECVKRKKLDEIPKGVISKVLYTGAISFCAVNDLFSTGDQKTPGTFFEYYISYLFKLVLQVQPVNTIKVLDYDSLNTNLATDLIFNLGAGKPKFHVPIKTSTRERAIMLWAHQKLLDGVYGIEKFIGTPVLMAETKTELKTKQVVEICLPDQWLVYQLYISKLKRIYYLDMPDAYKKLSSSVPPIHVKPLVEFFFEWDTIYD